MLVQYAVDGHEPLISEHVSKVLKYGVISSVFKKHINLHAYFTLFENSTANPQILSRNKVCSYSNGIYMGDAGIRLSFTVVITLELCP
jgi:hypothetical protein